MNQSSLFSFLTGLLRWGQGVLLGGALLVATNLTSAAEARLNVVLIIGDDISPEDLGCYGNLGIRTPNLDRLAAESSRFTNAFLTASSCSPSRTSIITGRYPHNLEAAAELHAPLPRGPALFPQELRAAGYHTAHAGKAHFGLVGNSLRGPALEAFDVGGDAERTPLDGPGGEGNWIARLRQRPEGKPFFMWFASNDAHRKWQAESFSGINRPADVTVPPFLVDTPETRVDLAHYYDEITRLDHHVGQVMAELERQQVLDQTVVIFMADNGRPFPYSKTRLYDHGIKTPLLIRWPHPQPTSAQVNALVSAIDLAPTILEIARCPIPDSVQGISFLPVLRDPHAVVRDVAFAEQNWHNFPAHVRLARSGPWAYLRNSWPELPLPGASDTFYNPSADALRAGLADGTLTPAQSLVFTLPHPTEALYNLETDPFQLNNLAHSPAFQKPLTVMRSLLDRWTRETGDTVPSVRTAPDIELETGKRIPPHVMRGEPPGAAAHALQINHPGPIRLDAGNLLLR